MNIVKRFIAACSISILALPSLVAADIFIQIEGISGEAVAFSQAVREGEIEVLAWSWGVRASTSPGASSARPGADGSGNFRLSKGVDKSTPLLAQAVTQNTALDRLIVTETLARGDSVTVQLDSVRLVGLEIEGGRETLSLDYGSISITYTPQRGTGEPSSFSAAGSLQASPRRQGR